MRKLLDFGISCLNSFEQFVGLYTQLDGMLTQANQRACSIGRDGPVDVCTPWVGVKGFISIYRRSFLLVVMPAALARHPR